MSNITQITQDRATRTPLSARGELGCSGGVKSPAPHVTPVVLLGPYST